MYDGTELIDSQVACYIISQVTVLAFLSVNDLY